MSLSRRVPLVARCTIRGPAGGVRRWFARPVAVAAYAGQRRRDQIAADAAPARPAGSAVPPASATPSPASLPVAPGAGALPQTRAFPSTKSAAFRNAMTDLWLAVTTGNPRFGLPAFFPEAAYEQLKAIPYPAADWQDRLWYDFALDVGAAHGLVARSARLVRVIVP